MKKHNLFFLIALFLSPSAVYGSEFFCTAGNVTCLIAAINQANSTPEDDTINLDPGIYTLTTIDNGGVPPPFPLLSEGANGLPLVTSRIMIRGTSAASTVIERDPAAPALRLFQVTATGSLKLSGLTLRNGTALGFFYWGGIREGAAGAVFNAGTLAIDHSIVTNNSAKSAASTTAAGGAIVNAGTAIISNSSIVENFVNANHGASGGAIANRGTLTITNSSITANFAVAGGASGGAVSNGGNATLTNSTVAGNSAEGPVYGSAGGAIGNGGTLTITNSTLVNNSNMGSPGGGGVYNSGVIILQNAILARNSAFRGPDCFGPVTSVDHSLIGDSTNCAVTLGSDDRTGDPGLGEFTDDGTPGNGHFLPLETSPAIDAGNNQTCLNDPLLATDQIGHARIGVCDIGAIEFQPFLTIALDVRPDSVENPINPKSNGVIPVVILSTNSFDANTIDQASLRFGPNQALLQGRGQLQDVNGDGRLDLVLHFRTQASGIQCGDSSVSISGQTLDGIPIQGSDSITTVGCAGAVPTKRKK